MLSHARGNSGFGRQPWRAATIGLAFAWALVWALPAGAEGALSVVRVRVYSGTAVSLDATVAALRWTEASLRTAGVAVAWSLCAAGERDVPACARPPADGELTVRIVSSGNRGPHAAEQPLGTAVIDTATGAATLATVYADRVTDLARAAHADESALLGRAIAHEIGHLLMASTWHAASGLMRPLWRRHEVGAAREADWVFGADERAAMTAARASKDERR